MEYIDKDGTKKNPYIIHRTSIGCYERTLALIIEKFAGALPLWLAPVQVEILPISDSQQAYAEKVKAMFDKMHIRSEIDSRQEKIGYKIRSAQLEKIPYMFILGDKEVESGEISVRSRKEGDLGAMKVEAVLEKICQENEGQVL
ncbi:MAG: His/Gly/Thr/Pro-type tRNA ligase C-terminal domain-containing protein, partial [Oscillospiraceae bacterium]